MFSRREENFWIQRDPFSEDLEARRTGSSHSLAPLAADVQVDEGEGEALVAPAKPYLARAYSVFAVMMAPIALLIGLELVVIGKQAVGSVPAPALEQVSAVERWSADFLDGHSASTAQVVVAPGPVSEDEAREFAAAELDVHVSAARAACEERHMPKMSLWVVVILQPDGTVSSIAVEGATHGRGDVAACVGDIVSQMKIRRFEGASVTASQRLEFK